MLFHVYNLTRHSDTEVLLHGKEYPAESGPITTVKITNIISPVYFLPSEGCKDRLMAEIENFIRNMAKEPATKDVSILRVEEVVRKNIFINSLDKTVNLLKVQFSKKVSFENFESDFCEMVLTEFSNPIENLVISKGIMGPCVVEFNIPLITYSSNQKIPNSFNYEDLTFVKNAKLPLLKIGSIVFKVKDNQIIQFCYSELNVLDSDEVLSVNGIVTKEKKVDFVCFGSSYDLVNYLNSLLANNSPDVVLFYNCHQKNKLKIKDKILCDIYGFAQANFKGREFTIKELEEEYVIKKEADQRNTSTNILNKEANALIKIFLHTNALELATELAEISGYLLNRCLDNNRSERIEYTLLHELYRQNYLFPQDIQQTIEKYEGGLVLDPQQGIYKDIILLLDFNSLYPSIIREFNICFSTVSELDSCFDAHGALKIRENATAGDEIKPSKSFLPSIITDLVERRKRVKALIKTTQSEEEKFNLEIKQKAIKLTANSIYGCLGFSSSRFCNYKMASTITAIGRQLLDGARKEAQNMGFKVIYGDTDSIMIHTQYPGVNKYYADAVKDARILADKINSRYKYVEIEFEKAFKKLLLCTKKKYAALVFKDGSTVLEVKGMDLVRRDICRLTSDLLQEVLDVILCDEDKKSAVPDTAKAQEIYNICNKYYSNMENFPKTYFQMNAVLSKDPGQYTHGNIPASAQLALRLEKEKGILYKQDDVVHYVIGEGEGLISARSFHPEENFKVDFRYYIKNQIFPSLCRVLQMCSFVSLETLKMIFNTKEVIGPSVSKSLLTFCMPCCEHIQECGGMNGVAEEKSRICKKCGTEASEEFFVDKINQMLREQVSRLYGTKGVCLGCKQTYNDHLLNCIGCGNVIRYDYGNEAFDKFLSHAEATCRELAIDDLVALCKTYSRMSEYRNIDMSKYFKSEIENYKNRIEN
ncbi:DNA polymerase alpha subunit A [Enteropsectra breve]|nr:DNA polymerase alpha subunit A [Enteropsectra breve]